MKIIEIKALSNGGHRNQTGDFDIIPDGWAVIPDNMETKNFPFGDVTVKDMDGVKTVTKWTPIDIPESQNEENVITIDDRITALENAVLELIIGGGE